MEGSAVSSRILLPPQLSYDAPSDLHDDETKRGLWFYKDPLASHEVEHRCIDALMLGGIGVSRCPRDGQWAAFALAGAVVASQTGTYMVPRMFHEWILEVECHTWEALWRAFEDGEGDLDREFVAIVLRQFFPRYHTGGPYDRSFFKSRFVTFWEMFPPTSNWLCPTCELDTAWLNIHRKDHAELSEGVRDSVGKVIPHIPPMLEITIRRNDRTYQ